jgi:drug/metabolite transporter (DMT)-like permease
MAAMAASRCWSLVTLCQTALVVIAGPSSLLDILLLISPFFFWGTSMVAMKQLAPHTTPLLVASWRLIPAGIVLLAWAAKSGRKTPTQPMAWVAMTLFGLVDGAAFQASGRCGV